MRIEQKIVTTIVADEGKVLRRKSDGMNAGERLTLGYNYYDAGVALSSPHLETPEDYEEIDKPLDYDTNPPVDHIKRLKRAKELIKQNTREMNRLGLKAKEALEVAEWYPEWGEEGVKEGDSVQIGTKFRYKGKLFTVEREHTIRPLYKPTDSQELYAEVTPEYVDKVEMVNGELKVKAEFLEMNKLDMDYGNKEQ